VERGLLRLGCRDCSRKISKGGLRSDKIDEESRYRNMLKNANIRTDSHREIRAWDNGRNQLVERDLVIHHCRRFARFILMSLSRLPEKIKNEQPVKTREGELCSW
jgi:hypothetical protein